ncbi:MAG: flagellar filament capping protein FliD [Gammaproteobacteria bacterium]|nr:flagellar filament capping protein FliD [Gammaproteobacteria bacterium]MBL6999865.1 flagellar filament capping protein FliD [Gammaproteobacteria bacterium]
MASISSLGIGSGLDLSSIVTGLVAAERTPAENRLDAKDQSISTELSAFGVLRSSLALFQGSLNSLRTDSIYNAKSVSNSDSSVFTTSATNNADIAAYNVEVTALAKAHALASNPATAFSTVNDTIGTGTLSIRFGTTTIGPYGFTADTSKATQTITVSTANNNTTLSGLRDYINANDFGVKAAIVNDGSGFRMTLLSESTGASNSMEISVSGDGDGNQLDNAGLSQLAFNAGAQSSAIQTVAAQDAALSINGLDITRDTNTVTGAIDGVTMNLLKADAGNIVSVNVSEKNDGVKSAVEGFVESYNGLVTTINSLTSFNASTSEAGILIGDFTVRSISNQLRSVMSSAVDQLSGNIRSLNDIGLKTQADGSLALDSTKLEAALADNPADIQALFTLQGRPQDADISYSTATSDTQAGNYEVNVTTLASQGVFNGSAVNALIIDANNDNFNIAVDGITSDSITLTQASYASADALALHMQAQINDDVNLKAAGVSVAVTYDSLNNRFDISSTRYGSASKVIINSVDVNSSNDLGLTAGAGIDGVDVSGTINGLSATGNGQFLTSASGDSKGLALLISSGATGNRGSVSFSRGVAVTMNTLLDRFLETDGFIDNREDGLTRSQEDLVKARTALNVRMESLEARLVAQFSALDSLVSRFQSTSSFLTQQLSNLPEANTILK